MSRFRAGRALLTSLAVALLLGAAAFWPTPAYQAPPRPTLERPIVFDALHGAPSPDIQPAQ